MFASARALLSCLTNKVCVGFVDGSLCVVCGLFVCVVFVCDV